MAIHLRKGARRPDLVPAEVLQQLSMGETETVNLMEQIAMDMPTHFRLLFPTLTHRVDELNSPKLVTRMRTAGAILWDESGLSLFDTACEWRSDTARGWAAMAVGAIPNMDLKCRLELAHAFADDSHFAVREWAWLGVRRHICAEPLYALELLRPWAESKSLRVRRFASEATRPIGVWSEHISELKQSPYLAEPLLDALALDHERYVIDSVGNWLNDASKSQGGWVVSLCEVWRDKHGEQVERLCRRALRTVSR